VNHELPQDILSGLETGELTEAEADRRMLANLECALIDARIALGEAIHQGTPEQQLKASLCVARIDASYQWFKERFVARVNRRV
jgi:hypothetical protein